MTDDPKLDLTVHEKFWRRSGTPLPYSKDQLLALELTQEICRRGFMVSYAGFFTPPGLLLSGDQKRQECRLVFALVKPPIEDGIVRIKKPDLAAMAFEIRAVTFPVAASLAAVRVAEFIELVIAA